MPTFQKQGTVKLINAIFYAHHGVTKAEHKVGARYEVDVEVVLDISEAGKSDALSKTIDYEKLYSFVSGIITTKKYYLIESVATRISEAIFAEFHGVNRTVVRVRKRNPPVGGVCDYAEAEYICERSR